MSVQSIVGIVLLVVGIILLTIGLHASNSVADQISNTFTGKFTQDTTWYLVGGAAVSLFGAVLIMVGIRGKSA